MEKEAARSIIELLDKSKDFSNNRFNIEEILNGKPLEGFHQ